MSDDHWHRPLFQIRAGELTGDTGQTSGMTRREAISGKSVGAEKLWMGQTHVAAGAKSGDHHHGEAETAIYVVSGTPAFVFADGDKEIRLEAKPGDYIFVPPYVPHREENPGAGEAVVVIARSSQEGIVVNLESLWPAAAPRRARSVVPRRPSVRSPHRAGSQRCGTDGRSPACRRNP